LMEETKFAPEHVPRVFYFDRDMSLFVMEYLYPHIILRKGIIAGIKYPLLSDHVSTFLAQTLFHTSDLFLKSEVKRKNVSEFPYNSLVHLTEKVIYTEPYIQHSNNRHNSEINDIVESIKNDEELKYHVAIFKDQFMNYTQALLHADLHTGSIMVTQDKTHFIDPEFTMYGPMSFDIGKYLGNLVLGYYSQDGHKQQDKENVDRDDYKEWLAQQIIDTWNQFNSKFLHLWNTKSGGDAYSMFPNEKGIQMVQTSYMRKLFHECVGMMGLVMIRRILGIAHVQDLESISDQKIRGECETKCLQLSLKLIKERESFNTIEDVVSLMKNS